MPRKHDADPPCPGMGQVVQQVPDGRVDVVVHPRVTAVGRGWPALGHDRDPALPEDLQHRVAAPRIGVDHPVQRGGQPHPCRHRARQHHEEVPPLVRGFGRSEDETGVVGDLDVGHREVAVRRERKTQKAGTSARRRTRGREWEVREVARGCDDPASGLFRHATGPVQSVGDSRDRHARGLGDLGHARTDTAARAHALKIPDGPLVVKGLISHGRHESTAGSPGRRARTHADAIETRHPTWSPHRHRNHGRDGRPRPA